MSLIVSGVIDQDLIIQLTNNQSRLTRLRLVLHLCRLLIALLESATNFLQTICTANPPVTVEPASHPLFCVLYSLSTTARLKTWLGSAIEISPGSEASIGNKRSE